MHLLEWQMLGFHLPVDAVDVLLAPVHLGLERFLLELVDDGVAHLLDDGLAVGTPPAHGLGEDAVA